MNNKEIISSSINKLKFPLILGVVFIHNQLKNGISISGQFWYEAVINLFSYVLPCIAVPIFFIISGYLFFSEGTFSKSLYLNKIRKRIWSLLIPYILWNTFGLLLFIVVRLPALHNLFPNTSLEDITWPTILSGYWAREGDGFPFDFPLWYIRELMLMAAASLLCSSKKTERFVFRPNACLHVLLIMSRGFRIYTECLFFLLIGCMGETVPPYDRICKTMEFYQVFVFSVYYH